MAATNEVHIAIVVRIEGERILIGQVEAIARCLVRPECPTGIDVCL